MASTASPSPSETSKGSSDACDQKSEVASVKASFPNRCRVICDVGEYSNVVTVQPENLDVTIKFQLTPAYPTVIPEIAIRSESLTEENIMEVRQALTSKACEMIGRPMIQALIEEADIQCRAAGLKPGKSAKVNGHTYLNKKQPKSKKHKKKAKSEDEVEDNKKLPPMKTADDVVKRIIWDGALEKDDFIVGYFDRFRGLVEKYFSAFSWEDLASVDYDVLAVPKHRIQYFKYKDVKVWDKPRRIDNVFGSAEGTKTIDVVIKEVEEMERLQQAEGGATAVHPSNDKDGRMDDDSDDDDDDDDDSSDDDGISVTIGSSVNIGSPVNAAASEAKKKDEVQQEFGAVGGPRAGNEDAQGFDPYWRDKLRPNYFLCVRITNEDLVEKVGDIQDFLLEKEPMYGECCIPGMSLHVTLCTVGLDTPDQLLQCMNALNKVKPELEAALPTSTLHLHGVSHFYNRVIYAKVHHEKDFLEFCDLLKLLLREAGIQIRDGYEFVPHMTIMKVTRPVARAMGTKNINPDLYAKFLDKEFGQQKIDSIYLCSMGNERREDGFYLTPLELHFKC